MIWMISLSTLVQDLFALLWRPVSPAIHCIEILRYVRARQKWEIKHRVGSISLIMSDAFYQVKRRLKALHQRWCSGFSRRLRLTRRTRRLEVLFVGWR